MKKFTLIEIMFVVGIFVILISISMVAGSKVLRDSVNKQMKSELKMIESALKVYKTQWGEYPPLNDPDKLDCAEYLKDLPIHKDIYYYDPYEEPYEYRINDNGKIEVYSDNYGL
jgi:type II secretory pathway pseudopilin PulG